MEKVLVCTLTLLLFSLFLTLILGYAKYKTRYYFIFERYKVCLKISRPQYLGMIEIEREILIVRVQVTPTFTSFTPLSYINFPFCRHCSSKSDSALRACQVGGYPPSRSERVRAGSGPAQMPDEPLTPTAVEPDTGEEGRRFELPQPHPLPMPEYGGYFAPLTEYLPDSSHPISGFHR